MNLNTKTILHWAGRSQHPTHRHVAIVMKGGSVMAVGTNGGDNWRHAEHAALGQIWANQRPGMKLVSLRIMKDGSLGLARPCDNCMALIKKSGIRKIEYSNDAGLIIKEKV